MSYVNDDIDPTDIVGMCHRRHRLAQDAEAEGRKDRLDDVRFVRLRDQWPDYAKRGRNIPGRERPMLVVNRLMQFRNQVINEIRMNSPSVKVRPVDDTADIKTAEVFEGIIRHVMAVSNGEAAIDTAAEWQVDTGLGYIAVEPDWADSESWDQELFIRRCEDPNKWWFDPHSKEPDGSDAEWAIEALDMRKADFKASYPDVEPNQFDMLDYAPMGGWITQDTVRVAKYWWLGKEAVKAQHPATGQTVTRYRKRCYCSIIAGNKELERTELLFTGDAYIPLIPVYGLDTVIEGKRHLEGLIRNGKDPQRMLNYAKSASAEHVALVTKAPWIGTPEQFEGHPEWDDPNTPYSKLVYNPTDHNGNPIAPPARGMPPNPDSAWIQIEQQSIQDMQAALGIYDAALSANPNEQSGKALLSLQRQASQGTFHFSDNLGRSIKHLGRILVSMIPRYYDARTVARIIGEDGTQQHAMLDPQQPQSMVEIQDAQGGIQRIYNLSVGRFDVVCDVGPSYATKRKEAVESALQLIQSAPQVLGVAGDLIVKQMDWPLAQEIAERMKKAMPPQITQDDSEGQDPQVMQLQQQLQQAHQLLMEAQQHMQELQAQVQSKQDNEQAKLQLEQFKLETERMKAEADIQRNQDGPAEQLEIDYQKKLLEIESRMLEIERKEIEINRREGAVEDSERPIQQAQDFAEKTEVEMEKLAEAIQQLMALLAQSHNAQSEHMQNLTGALAQMSRPKRKVIEFDPKSGRPIGISEIEETT